MNWIRAFQWSFKIWALIAFIAFQIFRKKFERYETALSLQLFLARLAFIYGTIINNTLIAFFGCGMDI